MQPSFGFKVVPAPSTLYFSSNNFHYNLLSILLFVKQSCSHYAFTLKAKRGSFINLANNTTVQLLSWHSVHNDF